MEPADDEAELLKEHCLMRKGVSLAAATSLRLPPKSLHPHPLHCALPPSSGPFGPSGPSGPLGPFGDQKRHTYHITGEAQLHRDPLAFDLR